MNYNISLFGEDFSLSDDPLAENFVYTTLDTDLTLKTDLLPPASHLLGAIFLGKLRGLPLEELVISDTRFTESVLHQGDEYLFPKRALCDKPSDVSLDVMGVDINFKKYTLQREELLFLKCDDISLFDKSLAALILSRASPAGTLTVYEKAAGKCKAFIYKSHNIRGISSTCAYILQDITRANDIIVDSKSFEFKQMNGFCYLKAKA